MLTRDRDRNRSHYSTMAAIVLTAAVLLVGCAQQPAGESADAADTVYTNGRIYTVNEAQPWAEAVAIKDGKFLVVGSNQEVSALVGDQTKTVVGLRCLYQFAC